MSEGNEVSGQQAAQPVTASQGAQPAGSTLSPEVITVLRGEIKTALSEFSREQQSQRDKQERRIADRVKELETTFKGLNGGTDITPEQRSQLRNVAAGQIENEAKPEHDERTSQVQAAQPTPKVEPTAVEKLILKKFEKAGITIEDGDPELAQLKGIDPTDIDDLKDKIDAAITAKRNRLQAKPSTLNADAASRVSAATVTGSPADLKAQYYAELGKVRGNIDAIMQIKTKYRKYGLEV